VYTAGTPHAKAATRSRFLRPFLTSVYFNRTSWSVDHAMLALPTVQKSHYCCVLTGLHPRLVTPKSWLLDSRRFENDRLGA
jgi:hypothetical protein